MGILFGLCITGTGLLDFHASYSKTGLKASGRLGADREDSLPRSGYWTLRVVCSQNQSTSLLLFMDAEGKDFAPSRMIVLGSSHLRISECPSAKVNPPARL